MRQHIPCFDTLKNTASRWLDARQDPEAIPYTESWKGRGKKGDADLILFWKTPDILQKIAKICCDNNIVMQPRGGGTSLNDSVRPPTDAEDSRPKVVLVSLYKDIELFKADGLVRVGAAVTPHELNLYLETHGLHVRGCDTGAKESSQFGAMFTTNTGGSTAEVEGSLLDNTVGMSCITADGTVIKDLHRVQKDNASMNLTKCVGYLHFPVVLITDVILKLSPLLPQRESAMIGLASVQDALMARQYLIQQFDTLLLGCELMEQDALAPVFDHIPNIRNPLDKIYPFTLYIQTASSLPTSILDLTTVTQQVLGGLLEQDITIPEPALVMAVDETQKAMMHSIRHHITIAAGIAAKNNQAVLKGYDLSIPLSTFADTLTKIDSLRHTLLPGSTMRRFGHFLGGRLHNNVELPNGTPEKNIAHYTEALDQLIEKIGGSVASEHGAGRDLVQRLQSFRPHIYKHMLALKSYWDPKFLIAPGVAVAVPKHILEGKK
jgi:FAD/FMN-containing dehydrogenase